jgi:hypothetical protein
MADDWKPGDLARFVGNKPHCPTCLDFSIPHSRTAEYLVIDVWAPMFAQETCGLLLAGKPVHMCSCGFVKIERDCADDEQQQAIEVTQRQPVEAAA